ncbi:tpr repeat [Lecanosticta acicola]|uniref:Tpr repeat n=1 Tax=Lecanosticta acicola TaxID=111012 RepID=A0AAI8YV24_9PEZI|nr:tpr repeat [Lecanosticta acicola]
MTSVQSNTIPKDLPSNNPAAAPRDDADEFIETVSAAIPPGMQRQQQMSADEILTELNRVPLFMTSLDETDGEGGENTMLEAIKALAYEGTKAEVAENFRQQGNEAARAKLWKDAREFYTKAIQTLQGKVETTEAPADLSSSDKVTAEQQPDDDDDDDEESEAAKEKSILEACFTNRALCNLEMKNHGSCNRDCAAALRLNPRNAKAWYRAASACLALDRLPEALDACASGLQFDASNAALASLQTAALRRRDFLAALERTRQARAEQARRERRALDQALRERNIATRETDSPPEMEDAKISLRSTTIASSSSPDHDDNAHDPNGKAELTFPVLFLYPLQAQTDLVKAISEHETLLQHLEYLLPVPWDQTHDYVPDDVECYMETSAGGLIRAGKKLSLVKLLGSGKVEIVDGLVRVFVVPKARAAEWIEQFKIRRGKQ